MSFNPAKYARPVSLKAQVFSLFKKLICVFTVVLVSVPSFANDQPVPTGAQTETLDEVLVVGRRPGPPLWRVTNGENTLYVFGTLHPLPRKFEWDPSSIKHILTQASVFIDAPGIEASTSNPFAIVGIMRKLKKLEKLDSGVELNDLLPEELQQSLSILLERRNIAYRKLARLKPLFAADELQKRVAKAVGFAKNDRIAKHVRKLVRKNDVHTIRTIVEVEIDTALHVMKSLPVEDQIDCLATTVQVLLNDTSEALERAHAWIDGEPEALARFDYPDAQQSCSDPFQRVPEVQQAFQKSQSDWLSKAEFALQQHQTSFAVLPIREVLHAEGLLAKLVARGYKMPGK